jgi:hypothetical protein
MVSSFGKNWELTTNSGPEIQGMFKNEARKTAEKTTSDKPTDT